MLQEGSLFLRAVPSFLSSFNRQQVCSKTFHFTWFHDFHEREAKATAPNCCGFGFRYFYSGKRFFWKSELWKCHSKQRNRKQGFNVSIRYRVLNSGINLPIDDPLVFEEDYSNLMQTQGINVRRRIVQSLSMTIMVSKTPVLLLRNFVL